MQVRRLHWYVSQLKNAGKESALVCQTVEQCMGRRGHWSVRQLKNAGKESALVCQTVEECREGERIGLSDS